MPRIARPVARQVAGAPGNDDRDAERNGNLHRSAVVADEAARAFEDGGELRDVGRADEVDEPGADGIGQSRNRGELLVAFVRRPYERESERRIAGSELMDDVLESLHSPLLPSHDLGGSGVNRH